MSTVFNFTFVPWFRSVAPYIHKFRNQTFVVGVCGEAIAAGKLQSLAQDLAMIQSMGVKIVLVHGFRPQVNEQLRAKGHEAKYSHGMRITDPVALDCAQEAAGQLRYEIEAAFSEGLPNTPMAGSTVRVISGNFITARPVGIVDGVDFQHSGVVRKLDVAGITRSLDMSAMVLLSPFGFSPTGEAFNLTMEGVATSVATALQADKLIFVTEVPGIRAHPGEPESDDNPISTEPALAILRHFAVALSRDVGHYRSARMTHEVDDGHGGLLDQRPQRFHEGDFLEHQRRTRWWRIDPSVGLCGQAKGSRRRPEPFPECRDLAVPFVWKVGRLVRQWMRCPQQFVYPRQIAPGDVSLLEPVKPFPERGVRPRHSVEWLEPINDLGATVEQRARPGRARSSGSNKGHEPAVTGVHGDLNFATYYGA